MSSEARKTSLAYLDNPLTSLIQINAKNILDSRKRKQLLSEKEAIKGHNFTYCLHFFSFS